MEATKILVTNKNTFFILIGLWLINSNIMNDLIFSNPSAHKTRHLFYVDFLKLISLSNQFLSCFNLRLLLHLLTFSLSINDLNPNQRIKLLQKALQYTLPRLQATVVKNETEELPLFIEDIVIHTRKENSDEPEWKDNFESHSALNN